MSFKESYLSSPKFGYGMTVATTEQSINSTMKAYLSKLTQPLVEICYVYVDGRVTEIPYQELVERTGVDPFTVPPDADPNTDERLKKLEDVAFAVGFRARIGLPPKYAPAEIPDIVTFSTSYTNVTFRLMCAEFTVVNLDPGNRYYPASWLSVSQGQDEAWLFESSINLQQFTVGSDKYDTLPPDVQEAISEFHAGSFGVQQLLFDFDHAIFQSIPQIRGVEPGSELYDVLSRYFIGSYFTQLQRDGQPVLGCTVTRRETDPSSLRVTNVQMQVGPHVENGLVIPNPTDEQRRLSTLNYLCAVNNQNPQPPVPFNWNWLTKADTGDGVVAVNRDVFAGFIRDQLLYYIRKLSYKPSVRVWVDGLYVYYQWSLAPFQSPTVDMPAADKTVLHATYQAKSSDRAGLNGALGEMKLETSLDVTVTFEGNTIVVVQYLKIYSYVEFLSTGAGGNVVDLKLTNTFTLEVGTDGRLTSKRSRDEVDNSEIPGVNGFLNFFTDLNSLADDVREWISSVTDASLNDLPLQVIQAFIFPGGNTFSFKEPVLFSDRQDLVCQVVYADPSETLHLTKLGRSGEAAIKMALPADRRPATFQTQAAELVAH